MNDKHLHSALGACFAERAIPSTRVQARAASKKGRAKAKVAQKAKKLGEKSKKSRKPKKPTSVLKKLRAMAKAGAVGNDGGTSLHLISCAADAPRVMLGDVN